MRNDEIHQDEPGTIRPVAEPPPYEPPRLREYGSLRIDTAGHAGLLNTDLNKNQS